MPTNGYILNRSNFTVKKKHQILKDKTIYEKDYMALTNNGGWDDGYIPYSEGNFKIVRRDIKNGSRKHKLGDWVKPSDCLDFDTNNCEYWTLSNLITSDSEISITENKIIPNINYNNLLSFVYYGNASKLIEVTITDIIRNFPAEMYVTNNPYIFIRDGKEVVLGDKIFDNPVYIENPFNIDITTLSINDILSNDNNLNTLRYFSESYHKYNILDNEEAQIDCIRNWVVETKIHKKCYQDGDRIATITINEDFVIYQYYVNGKMILITDTKFSGRRIRPLTKYITEFFDNLSDFGKVLLNRSTNPKYTATLETYYDSVTGYVIRKIPYTWYTLHDYNLDIESPQYYTYIKALLNLSNFIDDTFADNLWSNMTHDSIKNMDLTYRNTKTDEDRDDYEEGISQLNGLFWAFGRQFDDLKRYIDNIKSVNKITYDKNDNIPDYFLTDTLQLSGWEVYSTSNGLSKYDTVKELFPGNTQIFNVNDMNIQFMKNLKINSRAIFSRKGTRHAIEMLMGLFGYCSYDFAKNKYQALPESKKRKGRGRILSWDELSDDIKINLYDYKLNEYVAVANNTKEDIVDIDTQLPVEKFNEFKNNIILTDGDYTTVQGLPVRVVVIEKRDENGIISYQKYIIPWFDKEDDLDGNPYFQMFGGWGKSFNKEINLPELAPNIKEIYSTNDCTIYDETKKYLKVVENLNDLINIKYGDLRNGDIYYVNDISDIKIKYPNIEKQSNYFIINDRENSLIFGTITDESGNTKTGWENISISDIETANNNGVKVLYLESLIDDQIGNNPHIGYWKYDDGETFIDYFRQLFKYSIENNNFNDDAYDCNTGELLDGIINCGFDVTKQIDNTKCWFFKDTNGDRIYRLVDVYHDVYDEKGNSFNIKTGYEEASFEDDAQVGKLSYTNNNTEFYSELSAFDLENQKSDSNDEAAANSIINIKNLSIEFNKKYGQEIEFKNYLYKVILPYLKQLIPSTTIYSISIDGEGADYTCFKSAQIISGNNKNI